MKEKLETTLYGVSILGIVAFIVYTGFGLYDYGKVESKPVEQKSEKLWRMTEVGGCWYVVSAGNPEAITHAGNCPNHDTTRKELQK